MRVEGLGLMVKGFGLTVKGLGVFTRRLQASATCKHTPLPGFNTHTDEIYHRRVG